MKRISSTVFLDEILVLNLAISFAAVTPTKIPLGDVLNHNL